ncbi:hypothetical protein A9Q84_01150 [Halobacteriovorax marinus]|uniref:DUF692 domain-containing protein n=1 Tax=Halobacteriovorax marinus TaxID=97084 RepID=A0A1Y5FC43_9BACT|nr:hypothetical protein A9Q84_01150 [Halobacteriovorax marinus]
MNSKKIIGAGLNLRLDYIDEFLELMPEVPFVEVITDNWHSDGPHHKKLEKIRENYPVSFHCVSMNLAGVDPINSKYLLKTKELMDKFQPFQISDHLSFQTMDGVSFHDLLPFPFTDRTLENVSERVLQVQENLKTPILIENLSYYTEYKESHMSELVFLNKLIDKTDALILFDLNNIWVNEKNSIASTVDFVEQINWAKVAEVHVAGPDIFDGLYVDTHGSNVDDEVIELVKRASLYLKNLPVVYERDNNLPPFSEILSEVKKIEGAIHG